MKKTLLLCLLVLNINSEPFYKQKIKECITPLFIKYFQLIDTISKVELVKKVAAYFQKENDRSQYSDFILTVSVKNKESYKVQLFNIHNLQLFKDKYIAQEQTEINDETYRSIKLHYPKLTPVKNKNNYFIKLNDGHETTITINEDLIDVFLITNANFYNLINKIYNFDDATQI